MHGLCVTCRRDEAQMTPACTESAEHYINPDPVDLSHSQQVRLLSPAKSNTEYMYTLRICLYCLVQQRNESGLFELTWKRFPFNLCNVAHRDLTTKSGNCFNKNKDSSTHIPGTSHTTCFLCENLERIAKKSREIGLVTQWQHTCCLTTKNECLIRAHSTINKIHSASCLCDVNFRAIGCRGLCIVSSPAYSLSSCGTPFVEKLTVTSADSRPDEVKYKAGLNCLGTALIWVHEHLFRPLHLCSHSRLHINCTFIYLLGILYFGGVLSPRWMINCRLVQFWQDHQSMRFSPEALRTESSLSLSSRVHLSSS